MKRLNNIFFTGLLIFCLGYIAHEIVGEAGVDLGNSAHATPIALSARPVNISDVSLEHAYGPVLLIHSNADGACNHINAAIDHISSAYKKTISELLPHDQNSLYQSQKVLINVRSVLNCQD